MSVRRMASEYGFGSLWVPCKVQEGLSNHDTVEEDIEDGTDEAWSMARARSQYSRDTTGEKIAVLTRW